MKITKFKYNIHEEHNHTVVNRKVNTKMLNVFLITNLKYNENIKTHSGVNIYDAICRSSSVTEACANHT